MGKFIFIPAIIGQLKNMTAAGKKWKEWSIDSYSKEAIYYYPYILASAWWEINWKPDRPFKEVCNMTDDIILFGDSGGFQSGQKNLELDVPITLEWQEENCDRAIAFDHPPDSVYIEGVKTKSNDAMFNKKMAQTLKNNKLAVSLRNRDKPLKFYNVIHGAILERRDIWYNTMKDLDFEYLATAIGPRSSPMMQAFAMCHILSKDYHKKLHVLGVGGMNVLPMFPYMAPYFEELTVDSSSYGQGARTRQFYLKVGEPISFGRIRNEYSQNKIEEFKIDGLPPISSVCEKVSKEEIEVFWSEGSLGGALITMHNLELVLKYVDKLNDLYNNLGKKEYKKYVLEMVLGGNKKSELYIALDFIDDFLEKGLSHAYHKYAFKFEGRKPTETVKLF